MHIQDKSKQTIILIGIGLVVAMATIVFLWQQSLINSTEQTIEDRKQALVDAQQKKATLQKQLNATQLEGKN